MPLCFYNYVRQYLKKIYISEMKIPKGKNVVNREDLKKLTLFKVGGGGGGVSDPPFSKVSFKKN